MKTAETQITYSAAHSLHVSQNALTSRRAINYGSNSTLKRRGAKGQDNASMVGQPHFLNEIYQIVLSDFIALNSHRRELYTD